MGAARRIRDAPERPVEEVVPARAVLTELARGFLMVNESDREQAARFARSFLRERLGPPPAGRLVPSEMLPAVRRGVAAALREPPRE
jgi:hypothetical protein